MIRFIILFLACILISGTVKAQSDTLGIDTTSGTYTVPILPPANSQVIFSFTVINQSNTFFGGNAYFLVAVDSSNSGNDSLLVVVATDSANVSVSPTAGDVDSVTVTIGSQFKQGINTVVIWPKHPPAVNSFATGDSLQVYVYVDGYAGINQSEAVKTILFPNPAVDRVYLSIQNFAVERVRILSAEGRLISEDMFRGFVDISMLPKGVYYLELRSFTGVSRIFKAIKE